MEKICRFILLLQQELEIPFKYVIVKLYSSPDDDLVNQSKVLLSSIH